MTQVKRRVLVVDDEADVGLTLKFMLEPYGFEVDCFTDPVKALENFKSDMYNLIILDIRMPKINGFELYSKFKSIDAKTKTIFLTALTDLDDYVDQKNEVYPKIRERHYAQKPVTDRELLQHVYSITN